MSSQMERLSTYISTALDHPLPPEVAEKTKHHVLDTLAAMVSGSRLKPERWQPGLYAPRAAHPRPWWSVLK